MLGRSTDDRAYDADSSTMIVRSRPRTRSAAAALLVAAAAALSACGDGDEPKSRASPTPSHTPPPSTQVVEGDGHLAVGITEPNPSFVRTGEVAHEFARWRDALAEMRPTYYRLSVDWAGNTDPDGAGIDFGKPSPGCMRDIPPCAGYDGVRAQLAAVAEAQ